METQVAESPSASSQPAPKRRRWTKRRVVWTWSMLGIGLPLVWLLWNIFGPPVALEVSKETTWLTEPLTDEGYVDYLSYLREFYERNGVQGTADDRWLALEAGERPRVPLPVGAPSYKHPASTVVLNAAESGETYEEVLEQLRLFPWSSEDYPEVAQTIESNRAWYDDVAGSFTPLSPVDVPLSTGQLNDPEMANIPLPATNVNREFARRFLLRAALSIGNNDLANGFRDIEFVYRIAARDRLCFHVGLLCVAASEAQASRLAINGMLSSQLTPEVLDIIEQFPSASTQPDLIQAARMERELKLDGIQHMHRAPPVNGWLIGFSNRSPYMRVLLASRLRHLTDWNAVLRAENRFHDEYEMALHQPDWQLSYRRIQELCDSSGASDVWQRLNRAEIGNAALMTEDVIQVLRDFRLTHEKTFRVVTEQHLRRRVVQIAARLSVWKERNGRFPDSLADLKDMDGVPDPPVDFLADPFCGKPLIYRTQGTGFELRSVGVNGIEDESGRLELIDSAGTEEGDDLIWRWPAVD